MNMHMGRKAYQLTHKYIYRRICEGQKYISKLAAHICIHRHVQAVTGAYQWALIYVYTYSQRDTYAGSGYPAIHVSKNDGQKAFTYIYIYI